MGQEPKAIGGQMYGGGGGPTGAAMHATPAKRTVPVWKKVINEAVATLIVLFAHFVVAQATTNFAVIALVQAAAVAHIGGVFYLSGPHANYLVSLVSLFSRVRGFRVFTAVAYIVAQVAFSVLAGLLMRAVYGGTSTLGIPVITTSTGIALLVESVLSTVSLLTALVLSTNYANPRQESLRFNNPVLVSFVTHAVLVYIGLAAGTGGCVNPLRHFGVAVFVGFASNSWIYYVSSLIGAVVSLIYYLVVMRESKECKPTARVRQRARCGSH